VSASEKMNTRRATLSKKNTTAEAVVSLWFLGLLAHLAVSDFTIAQFR
jgi:hypothetical protein